MIRMGQAKIHIAQSPEAPLTRTLFATASALLAATAFFAPRAEACISCEYVPSVVHSVPANSARSTPRYEKRRHEVVRERYEKKKSRVTETKRPEKVQKADKPEKAPKVVSTAKATPAVADAEVENSSLRAGDEGRRARSCQDRDARRSRYARIRPSPRPRRRILRQDRSRGQRRRQGLHRRRQRRTCSRYFPTVGQTIARALRPLRRVSRAPASR